MADELEEADSASITIPQKTILAGPVPSVADEAMNEAASSIASLHTSEAQALYRMIGGRAFTAHSDIYVLPVDGEEHRRLNMQHLVMSLFLGGLYPFVDLVDAVLREGQEEPPQILDVGAGSGRWAIEMADYHPWAKVIGMDLVPPALMSQETIPRNCRFEIDDANLPMDHYASTFSLVHARLISGGLNDANSFFYQFARVLKPGGVFLPIFGDDQFRDENMEPLPFVQPGEPGFTWIQYLAGLAHLAWWNRGCTSVHHQVWWEEWLTDNPNYSEVRVKRLEIPIGAWKEGLNERETLGANLMQEDLGRVYDAWRRLLLADGHPESAINCWIEEGMEELKSLRVHAYIRFVYFAAVRSGGAWEEMPPLWNSSELTSRVAIRGIDVRQPHFSTGGTNVSSGS